MKIQKVQSNQTTFGTKVKFEPRAVEVIQESKMGRTILKQAKTLEQNGINDILYISRYSKFNEYPQIMTSVVKHDDNITKLSNYTITRFVNKELNIVDMYERTKQNMHEIKDNKNSIKDFISFLVP